MATAVRLSRAVVLGAALALIVLAAGYSQLQPSRAPMGATPSEDPDRRTVELIARLHCSTTGLPGDVVPGRALVSAGDGRSPSRVRVTTFARGWAAYLGERSGRLVAVCP